MPFYDLDGHPKDTVLLRQIGPDLFSLEEPFSYHAPDGRMFVIRPEDLLVTDLASVPWYLHWFVARYGRHTLAALLHDALLVKDASVIPRHDIDEIFYDALVDLQVPPLRRRLMWAAVTLNTRSYNQEKRLALIAWGALSAAGVFGFLRAIALARPLQLLGAGLAPFPAAVFWGRDWRQGIIGGYGILLVGPPSVGVVIYYWVYRAAERAWSLVSHEADHPPVLTEEL